MVSNRRSIYAKEVIYCCIITLHASFCVVQIRVDDLRPPISAKGLIQNVNGMAGLKRDRHLPDGHFKVGHKWLTQS